MNIITKRSTAVSMVVALIAVSGAFGLFSGKSADAAVCPPSSLSGHILTTGENGEGGLAMVLNTSECSFDIGFASYKGNALFDYETTTLAPWQMVQLHVNTPECAYELDLFRGSLSSTPSYGSNLLDRALVKQNVSCNVDSTPTTPTPGPSTPGPVVSEPPVHTLVPTQPPTVITNRTVIGAFDDANCTLIGGWAFDPDSSSTALMITIYDGVGPSAPLLWSGVTNTNRPDVNTAFGISGIHGFTASTPDSVKDGRSHQIYVLAQDTSTGQSAFISGPKTIVCGAVTSPVPTVSPTATSINNSYNTNNTVNNSSVINQYGNGNIAGVNQGGINSGTQSNYGYIYGAAYATPTPYYPTYVATSALAIQKYARNLSRGEGTSSTSVSARPGDQIEFSLMITAPNNSTLNNVIVADQLPAGLHYVYGSTSVNGTSVSGSVLNTINIGGLSGSQQVTVRFLADVDRGAVNGQRFTNIGTVRADNYNQVNSNPVYVTISGNVVASALKVKTGAGDWGMGFALISSLSAAGWYVKRKGLLSVLSA